MPYTPRSWADGELVTAEDLNRLEQGLAAAASAAETVTVTATRGTGASAGTVTLTKTGHVVTANLTGLVLTGTSEVVAEIPTGWGPAHKSGHGYTEDTANGWWPTRATATQVQVMGPAPAGTTVEGSISWTISS